MSKSDAQRRSYLADQMTMGERVEALERCWAPDAYVELSKRFTALERRIDEIDRADAADDSQYFHDELRSLGRRLGKLEKASNPGMTHFVGDHCEGGHRKKNYVDGYGNSISWDELDRLRRIELAVRPVLIEIERCATRSSADSFEVVFTGAFTRHYLGALRDAMRPLGRKP